MIAGGSTDVGIASTVFAARDMDLGIVVVRDCCYSARGNNNEFFLERVFPRMARVMTRGRAVKLMTTLREWRDKTMTIAARHIDITTEDITCANGMPAFLAYPTGGGKFPTVVLMHERYGLVKHTKDQAMRCARDGFAVLAPNFFFKHPDQKVLNAGDSRYDMTDPESVELIGAALAAMKTHKAADPSKVVVMGYCQTGRHPLVYRRRAPDHRRRGVVRRGRRRKEWGINKDQPKKLEDVIAAVNCPVFGAFGEGDHIISLDDVRRFRDCLEKNRKSYDIHIYRGAPHGWLNDTMPGRYRKTEAEAGWAAQQRFLTEVFGGKWDDVVRWQFESDCSHDYDYSKNVRME